MSQIWVFRVSGVPGFKVCVRGSDVVHVCDELVSLFTFLLQIEQNNNSGHEKGHHFMWLDLLERIGATEVRSKEGGR